MVIPTWRSTIEGGETCASLLLTNCQWQILFQKPSIHVIQDTIPFDFVQRYFFLYGPLASANNSCACVFCRICWNPIFQRAVFFCSLGVRQMKPFEIWTLFSPTTLWNLFSSAFPSFCSHTYFLLCIHLYHSSDYCITCVFKNFASSDLLIKIVKSAGNNKKMPSQCWISEHWYMLFSKRTPSEYYENRNKFIN